jgi:hypothetical protein
MGAEQLYDLRRDPFEQVNLIGSAAGDRVVGLFRRRLLEALTDDPGSPEVAKAYLKPYRQWLKSSIPESSPPRDTRSALGTRRDQERE